MRAVTSIGPPAAKGTTMRVVLAACAEANPGRARLAEARAERVISWRRFSMVVSYE
jgi:hypothetical protein